MRQAVTININARKRQNLMAIGYAIFGFAALMMLSLDMAGRSFF